MDPIPTEVRVRLAGPVIEQERAWRRRDRRLHDIPREEDALARVIERETVVEEPPAHLRASDLHADLGQDTLRLVDDPGGELLVEDVQGRPHERSSGPCRAAGRQRTLRGRVSAVGRDRLEAGAHGRDGPAWGFHCLPRPA
jgi:hypothetical protein